MASPTKILETVRGRKRAKHLKKRSIAVRKRLEKVALTVDPELRRFIPGIRQN